MKIKRKLNFKEQIEQTKLIIELEEEIKTLKSELRFSYKLIKMLLKGD